MKRLFSSEWNSNKITEGNGLSAILYAPDETERCLPRSKRLPSIGHKPLYESVQTTNAHFVRTILKHDAKHTVNFIITKQELLKWSECFPNEMLKQRDTQQYGVRRRWTTRIRCLVGAARTSRSRVSGGRPSGESKTKQKLHCASTPEQQHNNSVGNITDCKQNETL